MPVKVYCGDYGGPTTLVAGNAKISEDVSQEATEAGCVVLVRLAIYLRVLGLPDLVPTVTTLDYCLPLLANSSLLHC